MKNLPLKKIITALAFATLVVTLCILLADLLYRPKVLTKRGFQVEIAAKSTERELNKSSSDKNSKTDNKKSAQTLDIATMIKNANHEMGAKIIKKCLSCHNIEKGSGNKIGPNLFGVVGRKRASFPGFAYSEAMKKKGGSWSYEELNQFLTSPKTYIPGTKMTFAGLKKDQDRANAIAYLEKMGK